MDGNVTALAHTILQQSAPHADAVVTQVFYNPTFIVLSYFVSLIGCVTTLELLHRRTSTRGFYNWFLLISSCITMGGIGIWCMHFIGNRAIVLGDGSTGLQIAYSPTFTAVSFFLPILVLLVAFYFLGIAENVGALFLGLAGFLTGAAVCGMHYVGQLGIDNYTCNYRIPNVIGAAVIAITASFISLSIFFRLRDAWTDGWWKRMLCAALLACAVSGMHSTAAVGTDYVPRLDFEGVVRHSRFQPVIVCCILSIATCGLLLFIAVSRGRDIRINKSRAQQLVLACAYFDESGRIMVTPQGTFPSQKITNRFVEKTFGEDELCRAHPTFMWLYAATRNWPCLKDLIPGMRDRINSDPVAVKYSPGHRSPSTTEDEVEVLSYFGAIFKRLFCVCAQNLADSIHEPLEKLGVLFEEPLETGVLHLSAQAKLRNKMRRLPARFQRLDVEVLPASLCLGRGKFLFLIRRLHRLDVIKFASQGYRFGSVQQLSDLLAKSLQVPDEKMTLHLQRMKVCSSPEHLLPSEVYLTCFMVRPSVEQSFDILVQRSRQNQLPLVELEKGLLNECQTALLSIFDNWTVKQMLTKLGTQGQFCERENHFRWKLYSCLTQLIDSIGDYETMKLAKFSARQFHIPCRVPTGTGDPSTCTILTVRIMSNIHATTPRAKLLYVPLSFFNFQQQADTAAKMQAFSRQVQGEFGNSPMHASAASQEEDSSSRKSSPRNSAGQAPAAFRSRISWVSRMPTMTQGTGRKIYDCQDSLSVSESLSMTKVREPSIDTLSQSTTLTKVHSTKDMETVVVSGETELAGDTCTCQDKRGWVSEVFSLLMSQQGKEVR